MTAGQLCEVAAEGFRNTANTPVVQALRADTGKLFAHGIAPNLFDQSGVGMECANHAPVISTYRLHCKGQSLIGVTETVMHKARVAKLGNKDPEFGKRLRALIAAHKSYRSLRSFALAMGWESDGAGQRLDNYLKGRIPDLETLIRMGELLGASVPELLGQGAPAPADRAEDDGARDILVHLLEQAGIDPASADTIANAFLEAQLLYRTIPEDEDHGVLARFSAHAAWQLRQTRAQDT